MNKLLQENITTGMEAADGYVGEVMQNSSPEELGKASNDANNIAKRVVKEFLTLS